MNFLKSPFCDIINACIENCPILVDEIKKFEQDVENDTTIKNCIFSNSEGFKDYYLIHEDNKKLTIHTYCWDLILQYINGKNKQDYILTISSLNTQRFADFLNARGVWSNDTKFCVLNFTRADMNKFHSNGSRVNIVKINENEFYLDSIKLVIDEDNKIIEEKQEQSRIFTADEIYSLFSYSGIDSKQLY